LRARAALERPPFSNVADFRLTAEPVAVADHLGASLVVNIWHLERVVELPRRTPCPRDLD